MYGTNWINMVALAVRQGTIVNDASNLGKAIVTLSIEQALIDTGKPVYALILDRLEDDKTMIPDFYENPAYLKKLLKELFGNTSGEIIKSIKNNLIEFSDQAQIKNFLNSIN